MLAFLLLAVAACVDSPDDVGGDEALPDDTIYYETVVTRGPDGKLVASAPQPITLGEQRAQNAERLAIEAGELPRPEVAASIVQVTTCPSDAMWLYENMNWTGNRICFRGAGTAYLASYPRYIFVGGFPRPQPDGWALTRGSYWPGSAGGWFQTYWLGTPFNNLGSFFSPWGTRSTFDFSAVGVYLTAGALTLN